MIYFNAVEDAGRWFAKVGFPCPARMNPAEHFMKTLSAENFIDKNDTDNVMENARKRYKECVANMHAQYEDPENELKCDMDSVAPGLTPLTDAKLAEIKYVAPWMTQLWWLLRRASISTIRSPFATFLRYLVAIFVMLMGTLIYYQISWDGYEAMQSRVGARFYLVAFFFLAAIQNVGLVFPEERAVFLREQASSLYDVSAYFVGKVLSEFPYNLTTPLISLLIVYWTWDLQNSKDYNFWFTLANYEVLYLVGVGYGLILGAIVSDRNTLITMMTVILLPMMLLSGFFVKLTTSAHIMWLLQFISPCKFGMNIDMRVRAHVNA